MYIFGDITVIFVPLKYKLFIGVLVHNHDMRPADVSNVIRMRTSLDIDTGFYSSAHMHNPGYGKHHNF